MLSRGKPGSRQQRKSEEVCVRKCSTLWRSKRTRVCRVVQATDRSAQRREAKVLISDGSKGGSAMLRDEQRRERQRCLFESTKEAGSKWTIFEDRFEKEVAGGTRE